MTKTPLALLLPCFLLTAACGDEEPAPPIIIVVDAGVSVDGGFAPAPTLETNAALSYAVVYQGGTGQVFGVPKRWTPVDVTHSPMGELWGIQRASREPGFTDANECTVEAAQGRPVANDCASLPGSTVAIVDPESEEAATAGNGRATVVVDGNSWHFMRRPAGIAFGATETEVLPTDQGAEGLLTEPVTYTNTFANCIEHATANPTDTPPFTGPALWTSDPAVYQNGGNGPAGNGTHLDMVHGTQYCVGIAWEQDNIYWLFNGALGTLDRYDFAKPHVAGGAYHGDAEVFRYTFDDALTRLPYVPSNMEMSGSMLYIADTGNGRIVAYDTATPFIKTADWRTFENLPAEEMDAQILTVVADTTTLEAEWGSTVEPSGLAVLDDSTLVVANHGSGHLSLLGMDGTFVRTVDTGLGAGIGGLTVSNGVIYFTHLTERRIYRVDVSDMPE